MTKTTNYQLNQWAKSDRVMMDDFNADNTKIDAALKANADTAAAASAAVALCGNCKIETSTYTGNGKYGSANPVTLTFPKKPSLVIVFGYDALLIITDHNSGRTDSIVYSQGANIAFWDSVQVTWTGGKLKFYNTANATNQANISGKVYQVIAFYAQDK